jgi:type VI secretion system protein ImpK
MNEKPTLRTLSSDLIATVLAFRAAGNDERPTYRVFRQEIMDLIDRFERNADQARIDPNGDARFALVALIDETVMSSDWDGATEWAASPLQMHYFGDFNAGTRVFERIEEVQRHAEEDLLELYFTVLCAGFRGQYNDDPTALMSIRNKLYRRLPVPQLRDEGHLTPEAYGRELERPLLTRRFPFVWLVPFFVGAVGLYAAYYIILEAQVVGIESLAREPIVARHATP